ncbi:hypothetical protein A6A40_24260 (plasmid) [Azospirillum humicireducens]|uniref:YcaO domain-containing protein n=1 Tax=Azospirillum humicireducens TaxID=1226968 RepID=A0A2R4VUN6_9PROT|nr:YcaO-like family protein [Azospirillum humicireducens]AWB08145.1 hypothetical protein A6A40_24260 [Azospirillum humicireducens]
MTVTSQNFGEKNNAGDEGIPSPASIGFSSTQVKRYRYGTHRSISPDETLERIMPHLKKFGITRVANITGLDSIGLPVFSVYRPNSRSLAVSQGKGLDLSAARVSGLMEAIEFYHAERVKLPLRWACFTELQQEASVLDVSRLPRMTTSRFHPFRPILWCEGRDLIGGEQVWVPYESVHTDFSLPLPGGSGNFQMSSNGLASGNHWLEAVGHGICEVVERDALALWSIDGASANPAGRLDLSTVDDPACRQAINLFRAAGQAIGVWSITTDIGLPAFACVIADREPNHLDQFYSSDGSGCHATREIALLRALTEAAQTRLTYIAGARDDVHRDFFKSARDPARVALMLARIERDEIAPALSFQAIPTMDQDSFDDDIAHQLARLRAVGIEQVVAVDLGGYVPGIEVARVIIPGLEGLHDAPGYCPGPRARIRARRECDHQ